MLAITTYDVGGPFILVRNRLETATPSPKSYTEPQAQNRKCSKSYDDPFNPGSPNQTLQHESNNTNSDNDNN